MSNIKPPRFVMEQVALCPKDPTRARKLLSDLGLDSWVTDNVHAKGKVRGIDGENHALLQFNYQSNIKTVYVQADDSESSTSGKVSMSEPVGIELELLHYTSGRSWMDGLENSASHIGMHCTAEELVKFRDYFAQEGIPVAQEVVTQGHTNAHIRDNRRYNYVIFATRDIIGVDLKFIVRLAYVPAATDNAIRAAHGHAELRAKSERALAEAQEQNASLRRQLNALKRLRKQDTEDNKAIAGAVKRATRKKPAAR